MSHDHANRRPSRSFRGFAIPCLMILLTAQGCAFDPFGRRAPEFVPPPAQADQWQLVAHLNGNAQRIVAWRCNDATISGKGMPIRLSAQIAVETPQRFRLVASSLTGNEADFGSNDERFWFWMRRSEPKNVFTVTHEDFRRLGPKLQIPFQPDWLMEALGVGQLDAREFRVIHDPQRPLARLIAERLMPDGQTVQRSIVVDVRRGVILEHSLYDAAGRLLAKATLSDHRVLQPSGVTMPHRIDLEWPQADLQLTLAIPRIEVNPPNMPPGTWQIPEISDSPMVDLGALYDRRHAVQPAGGFGR